MFEFGATFSGTDPLLPAVPLVKLPFCTISVSSKYSVLICSSPAKNPLAIMLLGKKFDNVTL